MSASYSQENPYCRYLSLVCFRWFEAACSSNAFEASIWHAAAEMIDATLEH